MSSICKYCNKVELTFDQAFKSKTGKLIPLEKASGLPHQCSDNPYSKQQQIATSSQNHAQESSNSEGSVTESSFQSVLNAKFDMINAKLDRISTLLLQQQLQPQSQK